MNKSDKLRLYGQKDYTEVIEFPVELVGKDGVVRRYTYEESLLVYAKRIESAYQRYRDRDLASAEVDHCYKRIEQIKRSWKVVSSRRVETSADYAARYEETAAAECRSFIREYFGRLLADRVATDEEPIPIYLSLVNHDGPLKVFHVTLAHRKGTYLLYTFTFGWEPEKPEEKPARHQYAEWSRILASTPAGDDVERLLAAREGKDFGFLLTGPSAQVAQGPVADSEDALAARPAEAGPSPKGPGKRGGAARLRIQSLIDEDPGNAEAHYAMGVLMASEGDSAGALDELRTCVELQPFYLDAYRMIGSLGDSLSESPETLPYLLQARHYFPDDARVHFQLGLCLARLGRYEEALAPLSRALEIEPGDPRTRWLFELIERKRRTGADPSAELAAFRSSAASEPLPAPRPSTTAVALVALCLAASLVIVGRVDEMAGTFSVSLTLLAVILSSARMRAKRDG